MKTILTQVIEKLNADRKLILIYLILYFAWGLGMNEFGTYMQIARFTYWWQVITCYLLYMVPISLLLRNLPFHAQYAYGLVAMGFLEFGGYAIRSSYAYPDNILDRFFSPQNFSLGMALFFALYFPAGNWLVGKIHASLFRKEVAKRS
ncbi:MAG: hypothetical protein IPI66_12060 [Chitinophagaceae bacterium]|nr:hypothetical protein [Chitinophagaceae bacterium]MBL0056300.1 hypothetical protein [Chitinophagaceae bacterium]